MRKDRERDDHSAKVRERGHMARVDQGIWTSVA